LPRGTIDLALDLPAHDTALLATTANLVVTEDFHPALGFLLLEAATEVHGRAGILHKSGEFRAAGIRFSARRRSRSFLQKRPTFPATLSAVLGGKFHSAHADLVGAFSRSCCQRCGSCRC
jgi:hypothetical protein